MMPTQWVLSSFTPSADMWRLLSRSQQRPAAITCYQGQRWVWDQVTFEVLSPNREDLRDTAIKDNDKSCVIKVTSAAGSLLLTGDIEKRSEYKLLAEMADTLDSDVMVVPHHGSKTSSTVGFIQAVSPSYAIITNGYLNRFGHPKPTIVSRYEDSATRLLRSDQHGAVLITFLRGQGIQMQSWRQSQRKYWHDTD
jgi:competence protein ComEC